MLGLAYTSRGYVASVPVDSATVEAHEYRTRL